MKILQDGLSIIAVPSWFFSCLRAQAEMSNHAHISDLSDHLQRQAGVRMKTSTKIALAKSAYKLVHLGRAVLGRSDTAQFRRNGSLYELDLGQGIDFSLYLLGSFEPGTTKALKRVIQRGSTVMDIGANIGAHTLSMAQLVGPEGRVVACEPTDFAFSKLSKNLSLNPDLVDRVDLLQCFLGPRDQISIPEHIYSGWPLVGGSDLHPQHLGSHETTSGARNRSVDEIAETLDLKKIDVIKMDVDGYECNVLDGAAETLRRSKPTFVMELAPYVMQERGGSMRRFLEHFQLNNYRFYDEKSSREIPVEEGVLSKIIPYGAGINVVARAS